MCFAQCKRANTCWMENPCTTVTQTHMNTFDRRASVNWKTEKVQSSRIEHCNLVVVYWKGINWALKIYNWTIEMKPLKCTQSANLVGKTEHKAMQKGAVTIGHLYHLDICFFERLSESFALPNWMRRSHSTLKQIEICVWNPIAGAVRNAHVEDSRRWASLLLFCMWKSRYDSNGGFAFKATASKMIYRNQ